jgi:hypothetical protein
MAKKNKHTSANIKKMTEAKEFSTPLIKLRKLNPTVSTMQSMHNPAETIEFLRSLVLLYKIPSCFEYASIFMGFAGFKGSE